MIEELVAFTSTHLAMITLLMPWKKILVTDSAPTTPVSVTVLHTLWDMMNVDKWYHKMSTDTVPVPVENTDLHSSVVILVTLSVMSLFFSVSGYGIRTILPAADTNIISIVDFLHWGTVLSLLVMALVDQADFDEAWAFSYRPGLPGEITADTDKMFLSVGVIAVHIVVLSYVVGKDIYDRIKA